MKKQSLGCLLIFIAIVSCAAEPSAETKKIIRDGAKAKLTFRVTDSLSKPVTNVNISVSFMFLEHGKGSVINATTDTNGLCTVEALCGKEVYCYFTKNGYYQTSFHHKYLTTYPTLDNVKDGKWQPWNPTIEITLKEKRNPISMITKDMLIKLPKKNEPYGFDCKMGDLVIPYGKGEQADFDFTFSAINRGHIFDFKNELFITAVQQDEGLIANTRDTWSQFETDYEAQESGYLPEYHLMLDRTPSKILQQKELTGAEYLTFRSRIVRDEEGKIISSNYGKIMGIAYGLDDKNPEGGAVMLFYFFNPTSNDRNLESK